MNYWSQSQTLLLTKNLNKHGEKEAANTVHHRLTGSCYTLSPTEPIIYHHTLYQPWSVGLQAIAVWWHTYDQYIRQWEWKDLRMGLIARVAEASRKSVGPRFKLGRWSIFSCHLSPEHCLRKGYYTVSTCSQRAWTYKSYSWHSTATSQPHELH